MDMPLKLLPDEQAIEAGLKRLTGQLPQLDHSLDPFGVGNAFAKIAEGWLAHPAELCAALARLAGSMQELQLHVLQSAAGLAPPKVVRAAPDDERFTDPLWLKLPAYSLIKQSYLLYT